MKYIEDTRDPLRLDYQWAHSNSSILVQIQYWSQILLKFKNQLTFCSKYYITKRTLIDDIFDSLFFGRLEAQKSILDFWPNLCGRPKGRLKLYNFCLSANQKLEPEMDFICRYLDVSWLPCCRHNLWPRVWMSKLLPFRPHLTPSGATFPTRYLL